MARLEDMKDALRDALKTELQKSLPLLDLDKARAAFLEWLSQMKLPAELKASSWEQHLKVFPMQKDEELLTEGLCVRMAVVFYINENKYVVSLMESLAPTSRGVAILTVHMNWREDERHARAMIEKGYLGKPDDALSPGHVLWVQTAREEELLTGLHSCSTAILGQELTGPTDQNIERIPVSRPNVAVKFPEEPAPPADSKVPD